MRVNQPRLAILAKLVPVTTIRAIPRTYSGVRFRSTLEADWAYNLDRLGIVWQYEPEGVQLPSGTYYRPDFYLPEITTWLEVKGPHDERVDKFIEFAETVSHDDSCSGPQCGCWLEPNQLSVTGRPAARGWMSWDSPIWNYDIQPACCLSCGFIHFMEQTGNWKCRRCGITGKDARGGSLGKDAAGSETELVRFERLGW